jgi:pimeloyl-ACP methyl ester carboxylesterase
MSKKTYLLVPGAWHGSWCWERVAHELRGAGQEVICIDLRGCRAGEATRATLEQWADCVRDRVCAQEGPSILIAHSRGGIVISQVAEELPDRIQALVFVAGFLIGPGDSVLRVLRDEEASPFLECVSLSSDRTQWILNTERARDLFYGQCSEDDARAAVAQLGVEPAAPMMTPLRVSAERFGRVPRTYVECLRDRALPIALQRKMQSRFPCRAVSLDTDHAPFLSAPDALSKALLEV